MGRILDTKNGALGLLIFFAAACSTKEAHDHRIAVIGPAPPSIETRAQQLETGPGGSGLSAAAMVADPELEARVLVLSGDGTEPALDAVKSVLGYVGTPYTVWVARDRPGQFTSGLLAEGRRAKYQAVILTSGNLAYFDGRDWASALSDAEWDTLHAFVAAFGIRQVTWYTYPTSDYGFGPPRETTTEGAPMRATLTDEGRAVFSNVNAANPVVIENAWMYLSKPLPGATPLLVDDQGHSLAQVWRTSDGRENLAMTFDSSLWVKHTYALGYDVLNWATRGLLLGERRAWVGVQIDDFYLSTDLYGGGTYRMSAADLRGSAAWQDERRREPLTRKLMLDYVFNGVGSTKGYYDTDDLTPESVRLRSKFKWINHTYTHLDLNEATREQTRRELVSNHTRAALLGLSTYVPTNLVTGRVSGLRNRDAMRAAYENGVRYVVTDTSRPGEDNPSPNTGIPNWEEPRIFMVPRRPTNLFYNVSTPKEWLDEYNGMYRSYWGRDLTYEELLDVESEFLARYMLRWEMNPWMFHQANKRLYDGKRSLLSDLLDATFAKYGAITNLPIESPRMDVLARKMQARERYDASGVLGIIRPGQSITLMVENDATVPVTGLSIVGADFYAGQHIAQVPLVAGESKTFPLR